MIASICEIADRFGAVVLDQWGVLHDGTLPYPGAVKALHDLRSHGCQLAVLSNSGKRAAVNAARISGMGFAAVPFDCVMTSGEALWLDVAAGRVEERQFYPIVRAPGDAEAWAEGLSVRLAEHVDDAEAILLMGLADDAEIEDVQPILDAAHDRGLPLYCSNPDRGSPRKDGRIVTSPGAVAHHYADRGGRVLFYGKPCPPIFDAVQRQLDLPPAALLMVGDSLEHDIAGARQAGWATLFIRGGLFSEAFETGDPAAILARLTKGGPKPDYSLPSLQ